MSHRARARNRSRNESRRFASSTSGGVVALRGSEREPAAPTPIHNRVQRIGWRYGKRGLSARLQAGALTGCMRDTPPRREWLAYPAATCGCVSSHLAHAASSAGGSASSKTSSSSSVPHETRMHLRDGISAVRCDLRGEIAIRRAITCRAAARRACARRRRARGARRAPPARTRRPARSPS